MDGSIVEPSVISITDGSIIEPTMISLFISRSPLGFALTRHSPAALLSSVPLLTRVNLSRTLPFFPSPTVVTPRFMA